MAYMWLTVSFFNDESSHASITRMRLLLQ